MKADVSRADLLQYLLLSGEDNLTLIADCFGYQHTSSIETKDVFVNIPTATLNLKTYAPTVTVGIPTRPPERFCRLTEISPSELVPFVAEDEEIRLPDWINETAALNLENPVRNKNAPPPPALEPLVPWARLWPVLRAVLSEQQTKKRPDLPKLVKIISNGQLPAKIPQQQWQNWTAGLHILIDRPQRLRLFNQDYLQLITQLKKMRGEVGMIQEMLEDLPGGLVLNKDGKRLWRYPEPETPLLILSDLGIYDTSGQMEKHWLAFGRKLQAAGCTAFVLMPVPARYLSQELANYFHCISWDRFSPLHLLKTTMAKTESVRLRKQQDQQRLKAEFLPWLSALVEIEPPLLRVIRHRLPDKAMDVSFEALAWNHEDTASTTTYLSFNADKQLSLRDKFMLLAQQHPEQARCLYELVKNHHAGMFLIDYYEEINTIAHAAGCEDELYQQAQDYIKQFIHAVREYEQHGGLAYHAQKLLNRQSEQLKRSQDFLSSLWGILASRSDVGAESPDWVNMAQAYPFLNKKQSQRHYLLVQRGENLYLTDGETVHAASSGLDLPVFTLAEFSAGSSLIVEEVIENGQIIAKRDYQLHKAALIELPIAKKQRLHVNGQCYTLEMLPKPSWALSIGRDSQGLFVTVPWLNEPRLYWQNGSMRGLFGAPFGSVPFGGGYIPGHWEKHDNVGVDEYGLYADLSIKGIIQRFRWIEPGSFLMGSSLDDPGHYEDEVQHQVTLTQGYWLADTACTQALWQAVMGNNPSKFEGDNRPVENVLWDDVQDFIHQLNTILQEYQPECILRLPTEAEWEYACRARTQTPFNFEGELTLDKVNYRGTPNHYIEWGVGARKETTEVKSYPCNAWGLYEMHGNVWEWCQDYWIKQLSSEAAIDPIQLDISSVRVVRGGSWNDYGRIVRSAYRGGNATGYGGGHIGFRLVLEVRAQSVSSKDSDEGYSIWNSKFILKNPKNQTNALESLRKIHGKKPRRKKK